MNHSSQTRPENIGGTLAPPPSTTRVIAIWNRKGGVAKTTLAVNFADHFARQKQNVLLIDADPQGSATNDLGFNAGELESSFWSPFIRNSNEKPSICPAYENLDAGLCGAVVDREWEMPGWSPEKAEQDVLDFFRDLKNGEIYGGEQYHYIFIDCAGTGARDKLNRWALLAADEVIIPVSISIKGLLTQPGAEITEMNLLRLSRRLPPLMVTGIVPVLLGRVNQSIAHLIKSDVMQEIAHLMGTQLFPPWLEFAIVRQAESQRLPIGRLNLGKSIARQHQLRALEHLALLAQCIVTGAPSWIRKFQTGDFSNPPESVAGRNPLLSVSGTYTLFPDDPGVPPENHPR